MCFKIFKNEKAHFKAKKRRSKSLNIAIFSTGLTHGFGPKMAIFPCFFFQFFRLFLLGNVGQENVFYDILERKTPF